MEEEPEGRMVENDGVAQDAGAETQIDLLTGAAIRSTRKNRLVQKVLRQFFETQIADPKCATAWRFPGNGWTTSRNRATDWHSSYIER